MALTFGGSQVILPSGFSGLGTGGTATPFGGSMVTMSPETLQAWGLSAPGTTAVAGGGSAGSGGASGGMLGNIGIGASIGQAIGAAVGAFINAKATSYVLEKQAEINRINQGRMQLGYESALRAGESQISKVTREAGAIKAKQRTSMAANGVSLGQGSAAEVAASTEVNKKLDVKNIQANALANSWGYSTQAAQYGMQANMQVMGAGYQSATAVSQTIATGLESIGTVADRWYYYNR